MGIFRSGGQIFADVGGGGFAGGGSGAGTRIVVACGCGGGISGAVSFIARVYGRRIADCMEEEKW